jgi:uncharacterized protein (DUF427 family)
MSNPQNPEHDPIELITEVEGVPAGTVCQVIQMLRGGNVIAEATVGGVRREIALAPNQYTIGATRTIDIEDEMLQPA